MPRRMRSCAGEGEESVMMLVSMSAGECVSHGDAIL
jgi:hypothetical protein